MTENYNDGYEPEVSEDAFEGDPVLAKYQTEDEQKRLLAELEAARKERKHTDKVGVEALKRYADERDEVTQGNSNFNIFYANTDMKMAALYARTPAPSVKRRFDDASDDVSRVAGSLLQRNLAYELECSNFDQKFKAMLFDRLVPGYGVGWARLDQEEQEVEVPQPPLVDPMTGQAVPQEPLLQTVIANQFADIDYVPWDDFYWSPCRTWDACRWVARRVPMTKDAVKGRFEHTAPAEVLEGLSFSKDKADAQTTTNTLKPKNATEATVDVYELWDKERRVIFWFAEGADLPLDAQADTNEFQDFFPTPLPPLGRFSTSNAQPVSDYKLTQDLYNELDNLNNRCSNLVRALKLVWAYDSSNEALKDLFTTTSELEGVPVKDWSVFSQEKGGITGSMQFVDLRAIAETYNGLIAARDKVKAQIYEIEGMSDIQRAAATPYETKAATEIKQTLGSSRLSVLQLEVAKYAEALLRLKAHLICKFYDPQFILKRAGDLPEPDRQYVPQAIQLLKDKQLNHFRLTVSTDSLQLPNFNQERADKTAAVQALSGLLPQLIQGAKEAPALAEFGAQTIKWLVTAYKGSEELEGFLDQALQKMKADEAKAAGQKKPSPAELEQQKQQAEMQAEMQKQQIKGQIDVQVAQIQAQAKVEAARLQAEVDGYKARIKEMETTFDARFREVELRIEATRAAHENAIDRVSLGGA